MLKVRGGKLEWMQIMRSNDLYRGLPYNFLQFTTLHEVMAGWLGVGLGAYHHLSDSLHIYVDEMDCFMANPSIQVSENSDSLFLPREESEVAFEALATSIEAMTQPELTSERLQRLCSEPTLPSAISNLLRIAGAEAARRRRWEETAQAVIAACSNPLLIQVWQRWASRFPVAHEGRCRLAQSGNNQQVRVRHG
jgi:thymidylate synthase